MRVPSPLRGLAAISLLVLGAVAGATVFHVGHLARIVVDDAVREADLLAKEVYALVRAAATSDTEDGFERGVLGSATIGALLESHVAYSTYVVSAAIVTPDGEVLASSGREARRDGLPELSELEKVGPFERAYTLLERDAAFGHELTIGADGAAIGTVRLAVAPGLLREELTRTLRAAAAVSALGLPVAWILAVGALRVTMRSVGSLREQLDRLRQGEPGRAEDLELPDSFGELARELANWGEEVRSERLRLMGERSSLETIVNELQDAVLLLDPASRIVFYNPAANALAGGPLEERRGRTAAEALTAAPELLALVERAAAGADGPIHENARLPVPRFREALVSVFPIPWEDGGEDGAALVVLVEDITAIRTVRALVRYGAAMAQHTRLTASLVHEVRNPLNAMRIHVELLRQALTDPPAPALKSLDVLGDQVGALARRVHDFLQVTRTDQLERGDVDLERLAGEVVSLVAPEANERAIHVEAELAGEALHVEGDRDRLEEALLNVVRNAMEAVDGRDGRVRVHVREDGPFFVAIEVSDDGPGFDAEAIENAFQLYFSRKPSGSGIGLFLVQRIVAQHGGMVSVANTPSGGARVTLRLPVPEISRPDPSEGSAPNGRSAHASS